MSKSKSSVGKRARVYDVFSPSLVLSWGVQVYLLISGYNQVAGSGIFVSFFLNPVLNVVLRCVKVLQVKWPYMSLLESSQAKRYGYPNLESSEPLQLPVTVPVATPMLSKNQTSITWYLASCTLKGFQTQNRYRITRFAKDVWITSRHICHLCIFSEVQEGQAEPTCNYVPKV